MPRGMTGGQLAAIQSTNLRPAFFVEAHFVNGPIYVWTGRGSITWGGHTWLGVGTLGSISTIGVLMAGWSSANKYSLLGGLRASAQLVSYELALGLSIIAVLMIVWGTLADISETVKRAGLKSTSMVLVGRVLTAHDFAESRLYAADFSHGYRRART